MKKKILIIIVGILLMGTAIYFVMPKSNKIKEFSKEYDFVTVRRMNLQETIDVTGEVYPLAKKELYSDFEGVVEKINVKAGDYVKAGTVLLSIHSSILKEQWDEAKANLKQAEINHTQAKLQFGTELAVNKITVDNAVELENYSQEIRLAKEQKEQAEQKLKTLQKKNDCYYNGNLEIRAPFDGHVAWVNTKQGDKVNSQALLVTMMKQNALGVEAQVDQNDIGMVKMGQKVLVVGKDTGQTENLGTITEISFQGKAYGEVINFQVRLNLLGEPQGLQPGMSVDVTIVTAEHRGIIAVPAGSVTETGGRTMVKVLKDNKLVTVPIKLGYQQGKYWQIKSGLKPGDRVAVVKPSLVSANTTLGKEMRPGMAAFGR